MSLNSKLVIVFPPVQKQIKEKKIKFEFIWGGGYGGASALLVWLE